MLNRGFQPESTCLARKALKNTNSNKYHLLKSGEKKYTPENRTRLCLRVQIYLPQALNYLEF